MKHALLALALLPNLAYAGLITFTVEVNARDTQNHLGPLVGQVKFTFDDTKPRIVNDNRPYSTSVSYTNQSPFILPLTVPNDTVYSIGGFSHSTCNCVSAVLVSASGSSFNVDENGVRSQFDLFIGTQTSSMEIPSFSANNIVQYFLNAEKLTFRASAISYTNVPQPASNFVTKFYYLDENAKLISVEREAEVPEPATLASCMLGLGLIGFMRRHGKIRLR